MEDRQGGLNSGWLGGGLVATGYWLGSWMAGGGGDIGGVKKLQAPHFVVRVKEHRGH